MASTVDRNRVEDLYKHGLSIRRVAKQLNISREKVTKCLKLMQCPIRTGTDYVRKSLDLDLIKQLYVDERLSTNQIAKRFVVSRQTIASRLRMLGCIRTRSEASRVSKNHLGEGRYIDSRGYIHIKKPGNPRASLMGYIPEHIAVWEEYNHKALAKGCIVHHLNGIKTDNRPKNLIAMPRKEHCSIHHLELYKKRIRELETENRQLKRALENNQMILYV